MRIVVTLLVLCCTLPVRATERLVVSYLDRVPFSRETPAGPVGLLVDAIAPAFRAAGIVPDYQALPPGRALQRIAEGVDVSCSLGWFRTAEREAFAWFSRPIFRDRPPVLVVYHAIAAEARQLPSFAAALQHPHWVVGVIAHFSYGEEVDQLLMTTPMLDRVVSDTLGLLRRVASGRNHLMISGPHEVASLIAHSGIAADQIRILTLPNTPPGQLRHLMCSRALPEALKVRLDRAIAETLTLAAIP